MSHRLPIHGAYKNLLERGRLARNPGQAALVDRLAKLQQILSGTSSESLHNNGVYIYGDVGTGKSRIADLFATTLPSNVTRQRIHFHEFMIDIHLRLHRARSISSYSGDPLVQIGQDIRRKSRVLCFDEFQVNDIADAMILKRLFGAIWDSGGIMVSTSNRHPTKLYENGLNRSLFLPFIAELQRRCEVWKMEGNLDYRMSNQQDREDVSFTDSDAFNTSLSSAVQGTELGPITIPVMMNRELRVQGHVDSTSRKMIVCCTFGNLCEANLGSSDYHALCKSASTIYLSGLRHFASDELDFVRRFITLVDIAYETKTRIICLSSVPLFQVFDKIIRKSNNPGESLLAHGELREKLQASTDKDLSVRREGGSSSSMMSTFIGEMEWSATGLREASLASGGAGETDVRFAVGRAISRLFEMSSKAYGVVD